MEFNVVWNLKWSRVVRGTSSMHVVLLRYIGLSRYTALSPLKCFAKLCEHFLSDSHGYVGLDRIGDIRKTRPHVGKN